MIKFNGIYTKNKLYFIQFINDKEVTVDIPIDELHAKRIELYLTKIAPAEHLLVEHQNDDVSD